MTKNDEPNPGSPGTAPKPGPGGNAPGPPPNPDQK